MAIEKTKYSRKIDSMGRIVIPINLREELGIHTGERYNFFKFIGKHKMYLAIECTNYDMEKEIRKAKRLVQLAEGDED